MSFAVKIKNQPVQEFYRLGSKPEITLTNDVIWLRADGDELIMIRDRFDNIPITKRYSCTWSGDMANFIYRNLIL
jgi:hypothetical protein